MINRINPSSLAKYQIIGTVALFLLLSAAMGGYFYQSTVQAEKRRLAQLSEDILIEQKQQLNAELDGVIRQTKYDVSNAASLLKETIKQQIDAAHQVATSLYHAIQAANLSTEHQQRLIKETFRDYRFFGGRGYIFISSLPKISILLPPNPDIEGKNVKDLIDDTGKNVTTAVINAATSPSQSGFVEYRWYPPSQPNQMENKISYVKLFQPWGWIFGTGDYIYEMENTLKQRFLKQMEATVLTSGESVIILNENGDVILDPAHSLPTEAFKGENTQTHTGDDDERVRNELLTAITQSMNNNVFFTYKTGEKHHHSNTDIIALAQSIPQWQWTVIASMPLNASNSLVEQHSASVKTVSQKRLKKIGLAIITSALITLVSALVFSRWLKGLLVGYEDRNSEQNQKLLENAQELDLAAGVFDSVTQGILVTDSHSKIVKANHSFFKMTGYTAGQLYGCEPDFFFFDTALPILFSKDILPSLEQFGFWQQEVLQKVSGDPSMLHCSVSISVRLGERNQIKNYIVMVRDISERKKHENQLQYLAYYDSLTNLPNRRYLIREIDHLIKQSKSQDIKFALVFVDLDRFKTINDSLGHGTGDAVLIEIAKRLCGAVREKDTVARLGGDEFILLFSRLKNLQDLKEFCERIKSIVSQPIEYNEHRFTLTTSIGLSIFPDDGGTSEMLLKNADIALYESKSKGRNTHTFFKTQLAESASRRLENEIALRQALENNEFKLFYQPQLCLSSGTVVGMEALLRWQREDGVYVPPSVFIPLAEEIDIISGITSWVMDSAAKQAVLWYEHLHRWLPIAVNLSGKDIQSHLPSRLDKLLCEHAIDPEAIVIEVTESIIIDNIDTAIETLEVVRQQGFRVALDDFGTGYSSLHYLSKFPIDKLKIDKSFIDNIINNNKSASVTEAIIQVGHCLELEIVAEGVKDSEQLTMLKAMGCNTIQGYYFAKPLPANECLGFIEQATLANHVTSLLREAI